MHLVGRDLHAKVATGDHDRVGLADDGFDLGQGREFLNLGENPRSFADDGAQGVDIGGLLHEGQGNPINSKRQAEIQIGPIIGGKYRQIQHAVGQIHPLAVTGCDGGRRPQARSNPPASPAAPWLPRGPARPLCPVAGINSGEFVGHSRNLGSDALQYYRRYSGCSGAR